MCVLIMQITIQVEAEQPGCGKLLAKAQEGAAGEVSFASVVSFSCVDQMQMYRSAHFPMEV